LPDVFWRQINPTDAGGQFVDRGPQYRSVVFYHDEEQKRLVEQSKGSGSSRHLLVSFLKSASHAPESDSGEAASSKSVQTR
jgi:peptide methionine sulfoxide reductase MsrA